MVLSDLDLDSSFDVGFSKLILKASFKGDELREACLFGVPAGRERPDQGATLLNFAKRSFRNTEFFVHVDLGKSESSSNTQLESR